MEMKMFHLYLAQFVSVAFKMILCYRVALKLQEYLQIYKFLWWTQLCNIFASFPGGLEVEMIASV